MSVKPSSPACLPLFTPNITCEFRGVVKYDRLRFLPRGPPRIP